MSAATTQRGDRARGEILSAARWVLLERGIEGMTLREVARRASYSPAALYNHFSDKNALIAAVAMECVGTLMRYLGSSPVASAPERLRELGLAYVAFATENPAEYAVIFDCLSNPPHAWDEYVAVASPFAVIVDACAQGLAEGSLCDAAGVGASGLAYSMWALVDGHVHLRAKHLAHIAAPYDEMFSAGLDALLRGVTTPATDTVPSASSAATQSDPTNGPRR